MRRNKIVAALTAAAIFASTSGIGYAAPAPTRSTQAPVIPPAFAWSFSYGNSNTGTANVASSAEVSDTKREVSDDVASKLENAGSDAKAYFGENSQTVKDIQAAAGLYLGDDIVVSEIEPLEVLGYSNGSLSMSYSFEANFKPNSVVAVLIGIVDADGNIEWHVVQGVVNGSGACTFFMNEDLAKAVAANDAVIAVASSPAAFED